jgi:hypothetical protein
MKKGGMGSQVSYNVQTAVDTEHKLIIAHDVTNAPVDRNQLFPIAGLAQHTLQQQEIKVVADRGYYKGEAIKDCYDAGIKVLVPRTLTSGNRAVGRFEKEDFHYDVELDHYRCPADEILQRRFDTVEKGKTMHVYFAPVSVCRNCPIRSKCTTAEQRRLRRWEHEGLLDVMEERLRNTPDAMAIRACTVEHPFGTIKAWMGSTHFLMRRLKNVRTEMSLHVLAYNLRRMISIIGVATLMEAIRA